MTLPEFMLKTSREKAEQVLLHKTIVSVTAQQHKAFDALMNAPMADNAKVKRLLAKPEPWDK